MQIRSTRIFRRAFTLVELLVASGLLVLLASGIYGSVRMSTWMIQSSRQHLEAQSLASDRCWIAYRDSYARLLTYPSVATADVPQSHTLFPFGGTVRTGVQPFADHITITVRVDWVEWGKPAFELYTVERYDDR